MTGAGNWGQACITCIIQFFNAILPLPLFVIRGFLLGYDIDNHIVNLFKKLLTMVNNGFLSYRIREIAKHECGAQNIEIPCAYIAAGNDRLVPRYHVERFKRFAPNIEVNEIPGPHFILQAKPKECTKVVNKYLTT